MIYVIGDTYPELGGSHYFDTLGFLGNSLPRVNPRKAKVLMDRLSGVVNKGLIRSAHDCSEGGLGGGFGRDGL